jgi:hypothetical protein
LLLDACRGDALTFDLRANDVPGIRLELSDAGGLADGARLAAPSSGDLP